MHLKSLVREHLERGILSDVAMTISKIFVENKIFYKKDVMILGVIVFLPRRQV
jgi:hypothetical protein